MILIPAPSSVAATATGKTFSAILTAVKPSG
jgi:hypothetical protein